jgi:hypothetical protein
MRPLLSFPKYRASSQSETISVPNSPPTVVDYCKWGPWINGGAWIQTAMGKLDLLYRNIEQVQRVIDESQEGLYHHDYYQQPTFGFVSITYLAEIKCCLPCSILSICSRSSSAALKSILPRCSKR